MVHLLLNEGFYPNQLVKVIQGAEECGFFETAKE
jgi:hypothetical protein